MKHLMIADKSLLVGDEAADVLMDYATLIAGTGRSDNVTLRAIGADGHSVGVTFLLDSGTNLVSETADANLSEPENRDAINYMVERMAILRHPIGASESDPLADFTTFGDY